MTKRLGVLLGIALLATACATHPPVTSEGLALRRVVIYRNGVAYFEREGHVSGNKVTFRVRGDEVGDFLASFAVMEKDGSSVRAASFPLHQEDEATPVPLPAPNKTMVLPGEPKDPKQRLETVVMELDGKDHSLAVGYIAESPVWRPSYRLVLDGDTIRLQVWGIVQNLSGEDWRNTHLTVVADAPLSMRTQLEMPHIPERPMLAEGDEVIAVVPQSETSLAAAAPAPPPAPEPMAEKEEEMKALDEAAGGLSSTGPSRRLRKPSAPKKERAMADKVMGARGEGVSMQRLTASPPSRARNLASLAAVAVTGGATRYELPNPVTVPNGNATMLLLLDKQVAGESSFLFAPDPGVPNSASHPFRVARFTNQTGGLLERGPLAFFGEGGFLGQGVIDNLPEGASATVPFALEHSLAVERKSEWVQEGAKLFQIDNGQLVVLRQVGPRTTYTIKSGANRSSKVWIKHPRQPGSTLLSPPKDTEDNTGTGSALVPTKVEGKQTTTLVLNERSGQQQATDWMADLADQAVKEYLAAPDANPDTVKLLKAAFVQRADLKKLRDEADKLHAEQEQLQQVTEETRDNLRAIEKNKAAEDLRRTLTNRLAKSSARLDVVMKRLIELELQGKELELRFREALKDVRVPARA
jgi:hypothetical protein